MSTLSNALQYLETENLPVWKLLKGGKKVSEFIGTDVEEAKERLRGMCEMLQPGKYAITCRKSEHGNRGESTFEFTLSGAETAITLAPTGPGFTDMMGMFQFCFAQANQAASIQIEAFKQNAVLQAELAQMKEAIAKLTDKDPDNDQDAIDKFIEKAPGLVQTFKLFKGELNQ